jgi:hypothetical protein
VKRIGLLIVLVLFSVSAAAEVVGVHLTCRDKSSGEFVEGLLMDVYFSEPNFMGRIKLFEDTCEAAGGDTVTADIEEF